MPKYMLLLHDRADGFQAMSPEQMQHVIQKYMAWGDRLRASGILHDSQKLTDEPGRIIRSAGGQTRVTDGPYSETKEVLGGYYTVAADTYEAAVEIAGSCPHVEYGGTIEIRQIHDLSQ